MLATAKNMDVLQSRLIRAVFKARELALGARPDDRPLQTFKNAVERDLPATVRVLVEGQFT